MAVKPYQEGSVWSFRLRLKGQSIYRTGFANESAARREVERLRQKILEAGKPKHNGPWRTTLAQSLQMYALERLPFLKGARQESNRINRYLRAAGLEIVQAVKLQGEAAGKGRYFEVNLVAGDGTRKIPNGLHDYRRRQTEQTERTERLIQLLAHTPVAKIHNYQIQDLVDVMQLDGYEAASVGLERALIRRLFNYARKTWLWVEPAINPATHLTMPTIDNARDRVLTNAEWAKVSTQLEKSLNPYVAPAIALLLETAMRVSEPLFHANWADVDWQRCLVRLQDGKAGARDVPLTPVAMDILLKLSAMRQDDLAEQRILPITYETIKAAWTRACASAGIKDARIHDLRHTAATRFTLELNGNMPVLKVITGHKTYSQLSRYINVQPEDVSRLLHGRPLTEDAAPAGLHMKRAGLLPPASEATRNACDLPDNVVPLRRSKDAVGAR
ncbi:tyrosine-type recombinase/integrase [Azonexus sp.]|uniref:tyrosine-type recombinase/integrase n=1 Tax=Azonexus sp. TaxID=1872668 RepID=UPI0035B2FD0A